MTPYIFDDRVQYEDAGEALFKMYQYGPELREEYGRKGIEFVKNKDIGMDAKEMANRFIESMDMAFEKWKPQPRYVMEVV